MDDHVKLSFSFSSDTVKGTHGRMDDLLNTVFDTLYASVQTEAKKSVATVDFSSV